MAVLQGSELSVLVWWPPWRGVHVVTYCPRSFGVRDPGEMWDAGLTWENPEVKRPDPVSVPGGKNAARVDDMIEEYVLLAEHLTCTAFDGEPPGSRVTSTLMIFADGGQWKACLRDRAGGMCLWVAALSFFDLLPALEQQLADPAAVWRLDRASGNETAKRVKPQK